MRLTQLVGPLAGLFVLFASLPVALAQDDDGPMVEIQLPPPGQAVEIVATDFQFTPQTVTVAAGAVSFSLRNDGVIDHNLAIEDSRRNILGSSPVASSRGSSILDVTLPEGTYNMICTLPAHREAGMIGTISVSAS